jgi:hypothetical protein
LLLSSRAQARCRAGVLPQLRQRDVIAACGLQAAAN